MERFVIHEYSDLEFIDIRISAFPLFGRGQRFRIGLDRIRIDIGTFLPAFIIAGVVPLDARIRVGAERVGAVAVIDDVFLDLGIQVGVLDIAVLQLSDDVVRGLARIAVERDGIFYTVLKDADRRKIPYHLAVYDLGFRCICPRLHGGTVAAAGTVVLEIRNEFEQFCDVAGRCGHLISSAVVDFRLRKAHRLDLGKDVRHRLIESCGISRAVVVGRRIRTSIIGKILHTVNIAVRADGKEMISAY